MKKSKFNQPIPEKTRKGYYSFNLPQDPDFLQALAKAIALNNDHLPSAAFSVNYILDLHTWEIRKMSRQSDGSLKTHSYQMNVSDLLIAALLPIPTTRVDWEAEFKNLVSSTEITEAFSAEGLKAKTNYDLISFAYDATNKPAWIEEIQAYIQQKHNNALGEIVNMLKSLPTINKYL